MGQTFRIAATPRERFHLARLLCHKTLKFKDRQKEKALYRARKTLGLMEPSEYILAQKPTSDLWRDNQQRAAFEVTQETAEFLVATIGGLEIDSGESFMVEELLEQLEAAKDSEAAAGLDLLDIEAEAPAWKPSLMPLLEGPEMWFEAQRQILDDSQSYGAFRKAMLDALKTPEQREADEVAAATAKEAASEAAPS